MSGSQRPHALLLAVLPCLAAAACTSVAPAPLEPEKLAAAAESRRLDAPELKEALERALGADGVPIPGEPWTLAQLTVVALAQQPELRVARAAVGIADAQLETASQRPNPALVVLPQRVSNPASGVSPWLAAVQLDWPIETAGKRGHRQAAAAARISGAELAMRTTVWTVRHQVYSALVGVSAAEARYEAAAAVREAQAELVELLAARVEAGAIAESVAAPQQIALVQADTELAAAARQQREARAALAAALGMPGAALEGVAFDLPLAVLPDDLEAMASGEARRAALLGRSDVLALLAEYDAAEADLRLELAKQIPDVRLGPSYEFDQGSNKWGLALAVELPLLNQNQGGIAEAVARREDVAARFEALQTRVLGEVDMAVASLQSTRREAEQSRRLAEVTERQRARTEAGLAAGARDRVDLVVAELVARRAASALVDVEERVQRAASQLEQAVQPARSFAPRDGRTADVREEAR